MKKALILIFMVSIGVWSCKPENNEDLVQAPNRNNSVEMKIEVLHNGGIDVVKTTKDVWVKNALHHSFVTFDTIPALGDTLATVEDNNGDEKMVRLPKDYEIYITVK